MKNNKAEIINIIGWIEILGGIIGSLILGASIDSKYNWSIAIAGIIISVIGGIIPLGIAEIINLLQERVNQTEQIEKILDTIKTNYALNDTKTYINDIDELPSL